MKAKVTYTSIIVEFHSICHEPNQFINILMHANVNKFFYTVSKTTITLVSSNLNQK